MQFEPKVKLNFDENVTFFEIEKYDDTDLSHLTPEQQKELDNLNMKFLEETVEPRVKQTFSVCPCCMQDFIARNERRRQIMAADPRTYQPVIEQEDMDNYRYSIVAISERGFMKGVSSTVRECKKCHKIEYWGDAVIFGHLMADITTNFMNMLQEAERQGQVTDMNIQSAADILGDDTMLVTIPDENDPELTMETVLDDVNDAPVAEDPIGEEDPADFMRSGDPDGASEAEHV